MMILFVNENFAQKHNTTQPRGLNVSQQLPEMLILTLLDLPPTSAKTQTRETYKRAEFMMIFRGKDTFRLGQEIDNLVRNASILQVALSA